MRRPDILLAGGRPWAELKPNPRLVRPADLVRPLGGQHTQDCHTTTGTTEQHPQDTTSPGQRRW
ncbi:hypothetical protein PGTUg99_035708 [Puccinia graminis f. sp. tritici]|uniref:Uncharacterized protein n=1 Tax=Puccinia graminis f. sp. tritici TaxID=56615 RepID=A0A5B0PQE4_PUCGR|nr:hypothetical protein PGTUg99_035708 [Puccinia graminis f. sp. tritici]